MRKIQKKWDMRKRMIAGFFSLLAGVSVIISALFLHTSNTLRSEYKKLVRSSVEEVVKSIDSLVGEVYNVSDNFASSDQLDEYIEKEYAPGEEILKRADTICLYNEIFQTADMLMERQKLGGHLYREGRALQFRGRELGRTGGGRTP